MTPERDIRNAVAAEGLHLDRIEQSKHLKVFVSLANAKGLWVVSGTPSEHRAWFNAVRDLRRLARRLKSECSGAALRLVVPHFGTPFVGLQANKAEQEAAPLRENRCLPEPLCLGPSLPNSGRRG